MSETKECLDHKEAPDDGRSIGMCFYPALSSEAGWMGADPQHRASSRLVDLLFGDLGAEGVLKWLYSNVIDISAEVNFRGMWKTWRMSSMFQRLAVWTPDSV